MKRIVPALLITAAMAATLNGCVPLVIGGAAASGYYVGQDERPLDVMTKDAGITATVKARLIKEKDLSAFDINVDTYEGIVTLYGNVPNAAHASRAEKITRSVDGVKKVISKLTVVSEFNGKKYYQDEDAVEHPDVDMPSELPSDSRSGYGIN